MVLRRTWEDFERVAYDTFGDFADELPQYMAEYGVTRRQILVYINWSAGMTQEAIAGALQVTQQTISKHLLALGRKWPELFSFLSRSRTRILRYEAGLHEQSTIHRF